MKYMKNFEMNTFKVWPFRWTEKYHKVLVNTRILFDLV